MSIHAVFFMCYIVGLQWMMFCGLSLARMDAVARPVLLLNGNAIYKPLMFVHVPGIYFHE